jgi:hypothetical protein
MITQEQKNKMIEKGRIILRPRDAFAHYLAVYTFGAIPIVYLVSELHKASTNMTDTGTSYKDIIVVVVVSALLLTALYFIQFERLKLKKETVELDESEILEVINQTGKKFDWFPDLLSRDIIQGDSIRFIGASNRITILIQDKSIFINCRTTQGELAGFSRQARITDEFLTSLRMRNYELKHQREKLLKQAF